MRHRIPVATVRSGSSNQVLAVSQSDSLPRPVSTYVCHSHPLTLDLVMHERTHTGEKPLECHICGKRFSESSNLTKHRKTHNDHGEFICDAPGCGKDFKRADQLRRHKAHCHKATAEPTPGQQRRSQQKMRRRLESSPELKQDLLSPTGVGIMRGGSGLYTP